MATQLFVIFLEAYNYCCICGANFISFTFFFYVMQLLPLWLPLQRPVSSRISHAEQLGWLCQPGE
jgi:hypothetical protein